VPHLVAVVVSALLHLQLTPSVVQSLDAGKITRIYVNGKSTNGETFAVTAGRTTARIDDLAPGTWKMHVLLTIDRETYMVYETTLDVPSSPSFETTFDIPAVIVTGQVRNNGEPVRGQMHLFPSEHRPGNWGFAVPFDKEGRFEFPLPKVTPYDVEIYDSGRHRLTKISGAEFNDVSNDFDIAKSPTR